MQLSNTTLSPVKSSKVELPNHVKENNDIELIRQKIQQDKLFYQKNIRKI